MAHMQNQVATAASRHSFLPEPGDMDQKNIVSLVLTEYIIKRDHVAGHGGTHL